MRHVLQSPRRTVYAAGVLLAGWVAGWGLFGPAQIDRAIPWLVPPLHARFIGALYLSGVVFLVAMTVGSRRSRQWVVEPMIAIWTGGLFLVQIRQWSTIGAITPAAIVWLVAYTALPVAAAIGFRRNREPQTVGPATPRWLRVFLTGHGIALAALATALLVAPNALASAWPWPVEPFVVRIYAPHLGRLVPTPLAAEHSRALAGFGPGGAGLCGLVHRLRCSPVADPLRAGVVPVARNRSVFPCWRSRPSAPSWPRWSHRIRPMPQ